MDIWVAANPANAGKIIAVLKEFGFDVPGLSPDLFVSEGQVIRMGVPPVRLEILTSISGVSFRECYAERLVAELDGVSITLISLKHLKINKKASGRYKDLDDLDNLS